MHADGLPRFCLAAPMRMQRGALQVVAAEEAAAPAKVKKEPKKLPPAMDPAVKRAMLHEERRQHNKAFKSAAATRVKKVRNNCLCARHAPSTAVQTPAIAAPWLSIKPSAQPAFYAACLRRC